MFALWVAWTVLLGLSRADDRDRDGIRDGLEQALIERFRPRFLVSARDCDGLPAEFETFSVTPRVEERNATLYAHAARSDALGPDVVALELTYFHLWERDCGPLSPHPLDVESVSALVVASRLDAEPSEWSAHSWYAAAHEGSVCDTSNAARADAIGARESGPGVFISEGKHASYLSPELCGQRGCGVDHCREMEPLPEGPIVNVGEIGAPLGGSLFITSPEWPFEEKLDSSFDPDLLARLEESEESVLARVNGQWRPTHFSLSIGGDALGALGEGRDGATLAEQRTQSALGKTFRAVGRALGRVVGIGAKKPVEP
jgi:hypothetical protein